jgi:acyl carrier protein
VLTYGVTSVLDESGKASRRVPRVPWYGGASRGGNEGQVQVNVEIEGEIKAFLSRNFPLYKAEQVDPDQSLVESGVIDSLGILELVEFVEVRFDLRIPEDELLPENLDSIANITRYLAQKLGTDGGATNEASSS